MRAMLNQGAELLREDKKGLSNGHIGERKFELFVKKFLTNLLKQEKFCALNSLYISSVKHIVFKNLSTEDKNSIEHQRWV